MCWTPTITLSGRKRERERREREKRERKKTPLVVDTSFHSKAQGQRTHFARTNNGCGTTPSNLILIIVSSNRISICTSIFLMIGVSVERYLAVCRPQHCREEQGRSNRVIIYILPAVIAALAINVTKFFEVEALQFCEEFTHCGCGVIDQ
jgi:hypothetical protein